MSDDREEPLAAWLDGAMSGVEAKAFEAELDSDPELATKLQEWRANDAFIAAAFEPIARQPIDQAMLVRLGLADQATVAAPPVSLAANDNPQWLRRYALPLGGAMAASLAAVILLGPQTRAPGQDDFSNALETTPAMQSVELADGRVLQPTLTLRAASGQWCREYKVGSQLGLACRTGEGWRVEGQGAGDGPAQGDGIALANGADGAALEAAYRRLDVSDPIGPAEEKALIAKGWQSR